MPELPEKLARIFPKFLPLSPLYSMLWKLSDGDGGAGKGVKNKFISPLARNWVRLSTSASW